MIRTKKSVEVWRKGEGSQCGERYGVVGAIGWEKRTKESNSVKSGREWEEQMERAETILVHDGIICMRSTVCYS